MSNGNRNPTEIRTVLPRLYTQPLSAELAWFSITIHITMSGNLRIALDWTPNTLHAGLLIAHAKGYFKEAGLNVTLIPPDASYSVTPAKRLERGEVELAICPSESCVAYAEDRIKGNRVLELQAIYAILQRDASAVVTVKPEFSSCSSLQNGATYGSYAAKYEDRIVRKMISNAGGNGDELNIKAGDKLKMFDAVKAGHIDATWVFLPWEGIQAKMEGVKFNAFRPWDYKVPYGYSPVIARDASQDLGEGVLTRFVRATAQGYAFTMLNVEESVDILAKAIPKESKEFLAQSLEDLVSYFGDSQGRVDLGVMRGEKWYKWVEWLKEEGLARKDVNTDDLYTNEFFGARRGSN